jgi:bacterioferritin-associated ferredoxin
VVICPGLAITLVDYRKDREYPTVTLPYEFLAGTVNAGDRVTVVDEGGEPLGEVEVIDVRAIPRNDRTVLLKLRAPRAFAGKIAGVRVQAPDVSAPLAEVVERISDDEIVCRCERVTAGEIRKLIREGVRDMNEIKAITRAGMGACGGKTCGPLIKRLFREEGVPLEQITDYVQRPLFIEVPLGTFAGARER